MPKLVISGATLMCSEGLAPSALTVAPGMGTSSGKILAATVIDHLAMVNIAPFGMCKSLSNPQVSAAGAPQPCMPLILAPWSPGARRATFRGQKALTEDSTCQCAWSGKIEIRDTGGDVELI